VRLAADLPADDQEHQRRPEQRREDELRPSVREGQDDTHRDDEADESGPDAPFAPKRAPALGLPDWSADSPA